MVIDSLMPQEIGTALTPTPTLNKFRDEGTAYADSRSVFFAETIPNHVAMMTGVYPGRSGIPANTYWNREGTPSDVDLSLPYELEADTLFTSIKQNCPNLRTAAVMSKDYLYEVFSECGFSGTDCGRNLAPDFHFDPTAELTFLPSPAGLTPDLTTMNAALGALPLADFIFVNLGEVDRTGHADVTGITGTPLLRNTAILRADILIELFIQSLKAAGRWDNTVMFIVSDHGMDYSLLTNFINLQPTLDNVGGLFTVQNGGTESIYLIDQAERGQPAGDTRLKAARELIAMQPGVEYAWYVQPNSADLDPAHLLPADFQSAHPNIGDLVAVAAKGYRMSDPGPTDNPIPGNHGHTPTFRNTFMVGGGAAFVKRQLIAEADGPAPFLERRPNQSENVDVAPTVAWLLGLPTSAYEGRVLREAFELEAPPSQCGALLAP